MTKGYDPACEELARYFLPSQTTERLAKALAQAIQDTVEDWLESEVKALSEQIKSEPSHDQ